VFLIAANDGSDPVSGTFGTINGVPGGYTATVDYAFSGTDTLGRVGNGNDIAVTIVPEPATAGLAGLVGFGMLARRRARRTPQSRN
jgi:hypothetical protein